MHLGMGFQRFEDVFGTSLDYESLHFSGRFLPLHVSRRGCLTQKSFEVKLKVCACLFLHVIHSSHIYTFHLSRVSSSELYTCHVFILKGTMAPCPIATLKEFLLQSWCLSCRFTGHFLFTNRLVEMGNLWESYAVSPTRKIREVQVAEIRRL